MTAPGWHGHLALHYKRDGARTVAHDRHHGPLRVLQSLYPEGPGICHHVLVHPPGGVVGGDVLALDATLEAGAHALITTPGATRFYRSAGPLAAQRAKLHVGAQARLEWLPLEAIAYRGCVAENSVRFELAPGAQMMGWDLLALGLGAAGEPFDAGTYTQHLELPGHWLERGRINAHDKALIDGPLGMAGLPVMGTLWYAEGAPIAPVLRDALLDAARSAAAGHPLAQNAGATAHNERVVLLRALAARVEPLMNLLVATRAAWREQAWQLGAEPPRVWRT